MIAARTLIQSSYSREVELAADDFGARLMARIGGDARALGTVLTRISGEQKPSGRIWLDHPHVQQRVRAIEAIGLPRSNTPLLDGEQWAALQRICLGP